MISMPGKSYDSDLPPLTELQRVLAAELEGDVTVLATQIGERHLRKPAALSQAKLFVEDELKKAGYAVTPQPFEVAGETVTNLIAELKGTTAPEKILIVGAHYDSIPGCPAANDNGSGVAALLSLARRLSGTPQATTIRFVAYVNEEPPWFHTEAMGSLVHARSCAKARDDIIGMIALETMGYFSDESGSQRYPAPLSYIYPDQGNFIAFVGNWDSKDLVHTTIASFRQHAAFPSEGAALPGFIQGVGWSDHWSYWQEGFPALMVTDTAVFRYPHYHHDTDTPDKIDYERFARVVEALVPVLKDLAKAE